MAIHRGIQSAIFYYLSCAPCTEARHRRNRRKEADLARLEKQLSDRSGSANGAYQYQHPLPSNTNPAWDLEIAIGPSRESKAAAKQKSKKESSDLQSRSSNSTSKSPKDKPGDAESHLESRIAWASTFQRTYAESNMSLPQKPQKAHTPPSRSTTRSSNTTARQTETSGSGSSKPARTYAAPHNTPNPNYTPHPPLNDHHPPTVTKYTSPHDVTWMLEPPPSARVMRGYENERPFRTPSHTPASPLRSSKSNHDRTRNSNRNLSPTMSEHSLGVNSTDLGLGLHYTHPDDDEEQAVYSESDVEAGAAMEKRDSAGPQLRGEGKAGYLFPPEEWTKDAARRDPRWRWSIDW